MADNIQVTQGSGTTVRTDELAGAVHAQVIKLALGADGAEDLLLDSGQQTMANSIPVAIASDQPPILKKIQITPTISTAAYAVSDNMGGKLTLTNAMRISGGSGFWKALHIIERSQVKTPMIIHLFESDPTAATITDQSPITFSTDLTKVIHSVVVPSSAWQNDTGFAFASVLIDLPVAAVGSANLYAAVDTLGTPTFGATNALTFNFWFDQR